MLYGSNMVEGFINLFYNGKNLGQVGVCICKDCSNKNRKIGDTFYVYEENCNAVIVEKSGDGKTIWVENYRQVIKDNKVVGYELGS